MNTTHESIVLVGGGGGVYRIARFLKFSRPNITTIQTMFDRGRHSGQLRDERGVLPAGDIRQAILALADDNTEHVLRQLLAYRFPDVKDSSLNGATVGNILIAALTDITGSLPSAINVLCEWYGVKGKVLPVSLDHADLVVKLSDGLVLKGEGNIDTRPIADPRSISAAYLEPEAHLYDCAHEALMKADKIIFCPGDLFTSMIPNVLVKGFAEAVQESPAQLIYIVNAMTKKSETHEFTASRFASTLLQYLSLRKFDVIICNNNVFGAETLERYKQELSFPVYIDLQPLRELTDNLIVEKIAEEVGGIIRHTPRTASIIASL